MRPPPRAVSPSLLVLLLVLLAPPLLGRRAAAARPMTLSDLLTAARVGEPALSPDGRWVAYVLTLTEPGTLKRTGQIHLVPVDGSAPPHALTSLENGAGTPVWAPDGKTLAVIARPVPKAGDAPADRASNAPGGKTGPPAGRSGDEAAGPQDTGGGRTGGQPHDKGGDKAADGPQIFLVPVDGGTPRQLTSLSTGVQAPMVFAPDGRSVAFVSDVDPSCADDACNRKKAAEREASGSKVHHARRLLFRHWDEWRESVRHHVLSVGVADGRVRDLTPGDFDSPPVQREDAGVVFAPDGRSVLVVSNRDGNDKEAWTTNDEIFSAPTTGGAGWRCAGGPGAESAPRLSGDGKTLYWLAQARGGFEADRRRLWQVDVHSCKKRVVFETPDLSVEEYALLPDGKRALFAAESEGRTGLYLVELASGGVRRIAVGGALHGLKVTPDGAAAVLSMSSLTAPADVYRVSLEDGTMQRLTDHNRAWLAEVAFGRPETFTVKGAGGAPVSSWLVPPPGFDPRGKKKWPVVFLLHGGPQGAWADGWSYRWNPSLWAAQGFLVVAPNPRGSTGYGQTFCDEISRDWGGKVMQDLAAVFDEVAARPVVDPARMAIAGASYGGYAVNWLVGTTDRFRAAVTHDGIWNAESMASTTEELWFSEWEFGGAAHTPEARALLARWSPHQHADRVKTPTLIITNDLDYRVPVDQGLQMFTALRRRGVPAELLDFPDEGHWVGKPKNSRYWHEQVFAWLHRWLDGKR